MSAAKNVTDADFRTEVLESSKPVIVDFWAEWCGPCRMVGPVLDAIAAEHADAVEVVKLNVDENPAVASQYGITSIPAIYLFADGEVVRKAIGAKPKSALEREFADYLTPGN
ncbi:MULTISPECIES: thioredoxin [Kocuria]|jgi:thioredoxin 1|uniref:thioredoxin n=1 Tax=Kocuria TaxID=57493 RepID=UPI00203B9302|nr:MULTISPECIES: thioredoxin [Kocuria]MCM3688499.1 thioredoxin [Kocuria rosea]HST72574.1 thioredoxin [Kocuria rosea]